MLSACLPGMVLTILLLARLVSWFFRKHYSIAFHGIFGIVLASTLVIIPTSYVGAWEIVLSAVCCIGGFFAGLLHGPAGPADPGERQGLKHEKSPLCVPAAGGTFFITDRTRP